MIDKHLTSDEKNILKKVLQLESGFVVLHRQTTKRNDNEQTNSKGHDRCLRW